MIQEREAERTQALTLILFIVEQSQSLLKAVIQIRAPANAGGEEEKGESSVAVLGCNSYTLYPCTH